MWLFRASLVSLVLGCAHVPVETCEELDESKVLALVEKYAKQAGLPFYSKSKENWISVSYNIPGQIGYMGVPYADIEEQTIPFHFETIVVMNCNGDPIWAAIGHGNHYNF